jgi:hypothetical protein
VHPKWAFFERAGKIVNKGQRNNDGKENKIMG